ncbi:LPXTG cell wall anchor domain-containing protein [Clostridium tertium]|uniref:LPXTG cell wall anchor domain-containing protein n=1 Tax=Clostridium tertium TaxID=1559 RepID=UPI001AE38637|nr:LPXTG cell wall anchor domain-containing protein [Clostridium tertium]MBP1868293.1 LPXTG-motif cell wall-anchored protein [Clostridium tertium]
MLNIGEHWDEYHLRYDEKLGIYKVSFDITEDMLGSEVKIYELRVTDRGNNRHSETPSITCIVDKNGEISPEEPSKPGEPSSPKVPVINEGTDIKEVIEEIKASEEKEIKVEVNNKEKIVDKEVFKAIAGTDKNISFTQEDGTVWTFSGKDIKTDKLNSVKLSVSNIPTKEAKVEIEKLTGDAVFIKFDHHGVLPGKASVKVQVDKKKDLVGKNLTFYYYNQETKKIEKISDNVAVDENGYVIVEIYHCSDYFLSERSDLAYVEEDENKSPVEEGKEESSKPSTGVDKDDNQKRNDVIGNTNSNEKNEAINNFSQEVLPKTGSVVSSNILVVVSILMVTTGLIFYRRKATN